MTPELRAPPTLEALDLANAKVHALTMERDLLLEKVTQLQAILALPVIDKPPIKLSAAGAVALGLLYRRKGVVGKEAIGTMIASVLGKDVSDRYISVIITMLRSALLPYEIKIESVFGEGWMMSDLAKAKLIAAGYVVR